MVVESAMQTENEKNLRYLQYVIFLLSIGEGMTIVAIPLLSVSIGGSYSTAGYLMAIYGLLYAITSVASGRCSDIWGRKIVFISSLVLSLVVSLGYIFVASMLWLFIFRAIEGMSRGIFMSISMAIITDNTNAFNRDRHTGLFSTAYGMGMALGSLLGGVIMFYVHIDVIFYLYPIFVMLVIMLAMKGIHNVIEEMEVDSNGGRENAGNTIFDYMVEIKRIWPVCVVGFAYTGFMFTVWAFLSLSAKSFDISLLGIGILFALFWCSRLLAFVMNDKMVQKYQRKIILICGIGLCSVSAAIFVMGNSFIFLLLASLLGGIGTGSIMPLTIALVGEYARKGFVGFNMGFLELAMGMGMILQTMISGVFTGYWGVQATYMFSLICLIITLFIIFFTIHESNKNALEAVHLTD
jgi:MFS family permease